MSKIDHIKSLLSKTKPLDVPSAFSTKSIKKDYQQFHEDLEKEVGKIEGLVQPQYSQSLVDLQIKLKEKLSELKKNQQGGAQTQESAILSSLDSIAENLGSEIEKAKIQSQKSQSEMKLHQSTMENLLKLHKTIILSASEAQTKALLELRKELKKDSLPEQTK